MDTYGDMVTLLLCFFVMLYAISKVDQEKWEMLVASMNPSAAAVSQIVTNTAANDYENPVSGGVKPEDIEDSEFEDLYYTLKKAVEEENLSDEQVHLTKGDGYTFITFQDNVFFDGDSAVLKDEAKSLLDKFAAAIDKASNSIQKLQVLGHTSQGTPDEPNNPEIDWVLSSERAARVTAYLQMHSSISPEKMNAVGYGQFHPVASFDTPEDRAKNRRVEIIITKNDAVESSLNEYYKEVYGKETE